MQTSHSKAEDLSTSPSPSRPPASPSPSPPMPPPTLAAPLPPPSRHHTADELLALLNRTPLFMTELDETDGAGGENADLEALKALAYDGTRTEVAENFKVQGNECVRERRWGDAREFYSRSLAHLRGEEETSGGGGWSGVRGEVEEIRWGGGGGMGAGDVVREGEEKAKERKLEQDCLVNRALCNLELKNYGSCNRDCASVLRINPRNTKAYYRSALAYLALDKLPAATDACARALALDPDNVAVRNLSARIDVRQKLLERQESERASREHRERAEAAVLSTALKARQISLKITKGAPVDAEDARIKLKDPLKPDSLLSIPTLLLYPTHAQTDLIKSFQEIDSLADHLEYIFPCPWDEESQFTLDKVECYMETAVGGMVKVGKKVALKNVLAGGKVEVQDGLCKIFVVPKANVPGWIADMRKRKAA